MKHQAALPKYYRVKEHLKKLIEQWRKQGGNPIPSERELIGMFGVSRVTVRRAVDELVQEGYLFKLQGKGTYVETERENHNLINLTSCTSEITALGMTPGRKVLNRAVVPCSVKQASILKISSRDSLFFLDRIYLADDIAVNRTRSYLPCSRFPGIETIDFSRNSLYEVIEKKYAVRITRAHRTIEAVSANLEIADSLSIDRGVPVLLFKCLTYGDSGGIETPVEQFSCWYRSDRFKFFINQVR